MFNNSDEGAWSAQDDTESIFDDEESIFGDEGPVDTRNQLVPQRVDDMIHSTPSRSQGSNVQKVALVAVFDKDGQPLVARTVMKNGKPEQLEPYRRPTADEYNAIMFGGKIVRGGVVAENVPTGTNVKDQLQRTPLGAAESKTKKVLKWGLVGGALAGAGYAVYRWRQNKAG
jgi:hypothetical protein